MTSHILGINCAYHESSAAVIADGKLVAAVEEERLSGIKHGKSVRVDNADQLPWLAIDACLRQAGIGWRDLDAVAYSLDPESRRRQANLGTEGDPESFGHPIGEAIFQDSLARVPKRLAKHTPAPVYFVPHHEAHAWYAMATSPYTEAAVLVIDGIGEGASLSLGRATRSILRLDRQSLFPASVGLAWEKAARFLGLSEYDACKVMALAGLGGEPESDRVAQSIGFEQGRLRVDQGLFRLEHAQDFAGFQDAFGVQRAEPDSPLGHRIARGMQQATERLLLDLGSYLRDAYGLPNLVYAGGVALNCRANEVLSRAGLFERIHIGPASHDGGTAPGAAWRVFAQRQTHQIPVQQFRRLTFCGPRPSNDPKSRTHPGWLRASPGPIPEWTLQGLLAGETIGWAVGPCEFGPRALGARSLLAYPSRPDSVQRLNRLKGRRSFEPLALSIAEEYADAWFDIPPTGRDLTRAMLMTVRPRASKRQALHHLVHRDGSVRLQIVSGSDLPEFHALLLRLGQLGGLPLLLNTSLNVRGDPMAADNKGILTAAARLGLSTLVTDHSVWTRTSPRLSTGQLAGPVTAHLGSEGANLRACDP